MRTGIIGGTFDPIHEGHILIAKAAMSECKLDRVVFMPTGNSYMKVNVSPAIHRLNMLKVALKNYPEFEISDIEIKRKGNTYTCETIKYLKETIDDELFFIIGSDTLYSIEKWKEPEYLFDNLKFIVASRSNFDSEKKANELKDKYNAEIIFLNCDAIDISSTSIRKCIIDNFDKAFNCGKEEVEEENIDFCNTMTFIDKDVMNYIKVNHIYKEMNEAEIVKRLSSDLKESRLIHTMGVLDTAVSLAKIYSADEKKVSIAALLHDCAKYMPLESMIEICERNFVEFNEVESKSTALMHAKAGACVAYEEYSIYDKDIIEAIKWHTTGKPDMSLIEKIIFVSDYIEPGRTHSDKLPMYRMIATVDLDLVCMNILKDTVDYLKTKEAEGTEIDPMTNETYNFYKELISNR